MEGVYAGPPGRELMNDVYAGPPFEEEPVEEKQVSPPAQPPMMCTYAGPEFYNRTGAIGMAAVIPPEQKQDFCVNCGSLLKKEYKFCPSCGAPISSEDK